MKGDELADRLVDFAVRVIRLVAALPKLGGVGLDVHWDEPPDPGDPLYADPRVVAMPHLAGSTEEAFARITDVVIENLERLARGERLLHRVG